MSDKPDGKRSWRARSIRIAVSLLIVISVLTINRGGSTKWNRAWSDEVAAFITSPGVAMGVALTVAVYWSISRVFGAVNPLANRS